MSDSYLQRSSVATRRRALNQLPNAVTVLSLCSGFFAILLAFYGNWRLAAALVFLAVVSDGLDGPAARRLRGRSERDSAFGSQLDSLADIVSFGVAPAMLVCVWSLSFLSGGWRVAGYGAAAFYVICAALRLARFSVAPPPQPQAVSGGRLRYFVGLAAPSGAVVCLLPMSLAFALDAADSWRAPAMALATTVMAGALMVSRLPTWSPRVRIAPGALRITLLVMLAVAATLAVTLHFFPALSLTRLFWTLMVVLTFAYLLSLPVGVALRRRALRRSL